ncbi:MAG: FecR family protein [Pseudomonadota bacterium]
MRRIAPTLCALFLAALSPLAIAQSAGEAIFVFGKAEVTASNGARRALTKGGLLDEGDRVTTGASGRVQIRLADGGLIALRPATEFVIDAFHYGSGEDKRSDDPFTDRDNVSFFSLVKGGFRSLTGAVGREDKKAYRVRTPVATIGIRGTDYDAVLCAGDCATLSRVVGSELDDGLYVGVNDGGVVVANSAGQIDLNPNQFGFVGGERRRPVTSDIARDVLAPSTQQQMNEEAALEPVASVSPPAAEPSPDTGVRAEPTSVNAPAVDFNDGTGNGGDTTGATAFANLPGAGNGVSAAGQGLQSRSADGVVEQFNTDGARYRLTGAQFVNAGRDDNRDGATGLSWGRWSGGTVEVTDAAGQSQTLDVDGSIHVIASSDTTPTPNVPLTGTQSFQLIGNTDPTDNRGNVGVLGNASLQANFDRQSVDADVSLSFAQTSEVWNARADDIDINAAAATFGGDFDQVTITDTAGVSDGAGDLSGFFTGDDAATINGAGFTYSLTDGNGTDVAGSAAFQGAPGSP